MNSTATHPASPPAQTVPNPAWEIHQALVHFADFLATLSGLDCCSIKSRSGRYTYPAARELLEAAYVHRMAIKVSS